MLVELFSNAGDLAISAIIQLLIGILLSIPIYRLLSNHQGFKKVNPLLMALLCSVLGILLPIGAIGLIPIYIVILCAGGHSCTFVPLLASNLIFNMLIPFTELNFRWDSSLLRIISAFIIGILSYLLCTVLFKDGIVRVKLLDRYIKEYSTTRVTSLLALYINEVGLFLIAGILLNAFRSLYISDAMSVFLSSTSGSVVKDFLLSNDASNSPFFITSATIFNTVLDLTAPVAFLSILKLRGLMLLYVITGFICSALVTAILL